MPTVKIFVDVKTEKKTKTINFRISETALQDFETKLKKAKLKKQQWFDLILNAYVSGQIV